MILTPAQFREREFFQARRLENELPSPMSRQVAIGAYATLAVHEGPVAQAAAERLRALGVEPLRRAGL